MKDTTEAKEKKKLSQERAQNKASVRTDASFTPGYSPVQTQQTRTQPSVVDRQQKKDRDSLDDHQIQWVESPWAQSGGMVGGHLTTRDGRSQPLEAEARREKSRSKSPPVGWVQPTKAEAQREKSRSKSPPGGWVQPTKAEAPKREKSKSPPPKQTKRGSKETSPPPVPSYNPSAPDSFLLSNRPAYKDERKKEIHSYEQVVEATGRPSGRGQRTISPTGRSQEMNVPLRNKKKVSDKLPSYEQGGYVDEDERRKGSKKMFEPTPVDTKDVSTLSSSCSGLPKNCEELVCVVCLSVFGISSFV